MVSDSSPGVSDVPAGVRRRNPAAVALLGGLAAGLVAFGLGEVLYGWFPEAGESGSLNGAPVVLNTARTHAIATTRNAALEYAVLGCGLGLVMGLAGGLAGGDLRRGVAAGSFGLLLGGLAGAGLPLALVRPFLSYYQAQVYQDMMIPLAMHGTFWGVLGLIGGLAFGIGRGRGGIARLAILGLVGALVGTAVYEVVGIFLDPLAETAEPLSKTVATRLLARMAVALGTAATIALGLDGTPPGGTRTPK
ncbi:hypothetical protein OJF2_36950 [Aquisphaera giovannonii]|uniref:CbtA family protein n=1 Tax=Aquisphaera giovannonii TaxID=406548 RepID=A0A5B9W5A5_9BACT|nr:hypothetical protein [Aquisphaera giovannonii]QEH35150.1 hypothetical protein OJF2_36950 [Aquisphaera giovannonii]